MDIDSLLMAISFLGLAMAPFWAKWWSAALGRGSTDRWQHFGGVLSLSLMTMLAVHVGPWILMSALGGTLTANLDDPKLPLGMLMMFGPGILIQTVLVWGVVRSAANGPR